MRENLAWLLALVVCVAVGFQMIWPAWRETSSGVYTPSQSEVAKAQELLSPPSPPVGVKARRLAFYNSLRDRMDASEFGVLEAVAAQLRQAPKYRESPGYDLETFYSAVGGDRSFRGEGDEDWPRLLAFQEAWLDEISCSLTARVARAQTYLVSTWPSPTGKVFTPGKKDYLRAALMDLRGARRLPVQDPYVDLWLQVVVDRATAQGEHNLAEEALRAQGIGMDRELLRRSRLIRASH